MWLEEALDRDRFLNANEALEFGLIDKVITSRGAASEESE